MDETRGGTPLYSAALMVPSIYFSDYPENEQKHVRHIEYNLNKHVKIVEEFQNCLDLFVQSAVWRREINDIRAKKYETGERDGLEILDNSKRRLQGWVMIAARQGAMLAYSCSQIRQSDAALFPKCPTLSICLDRQKIKESRQIFAAAFPSVEAVRLSAAHPMELASTPDDFQRHAFSGDLKTVNIEGQNIESLMIDGNLHVEGNQLTYSSTIKGAYVEYVLSPFTLQQLAKAVALYLDAFQPAVIQR